MITLLGCWWLFFIFKHSHDVQRMILWEGSFFISLLFLLSFSFLAMYWKIQKKTLALNTFLASMTHELKTPLAAIQLKAEVIEDYLSQKKYDKASELALKLAKNTRSFENQIDKLLQLSRVEGDAKLNIVEINIESFLKKAIEKSPYLLDIELQCSTETILADSFALELIFRNLFENTQKYSPSQSIVVKSIVSNHFLEIHYLENHEFTGDKSKLGKLFYKYSSTNGSGIGLYLVGKLISKMNGQFKIIHQPNLSFIITLPKSIS